MTKHYRTIGWIVGALLVALYAAPSAHERKEVAGIDVVFGAEPEPAITGEMRYLRWRFIAKDKTPFAEIEGASAIVKHGGKTFGPFPGRTSAREPGLVATQHIFTMAGEYEATLTFKKKGDAATHTVTFPFKIADRKTLEIP
jgi:hypothetical protein